MKSDLHLDGVGPMMPNDKLNQVYLIYLLYGIGTLLPWSTLTSCLDFFDMKVSFKTFADRLLQMPDE